MTLQGPFWLGDSPVFPSPELADETGLLALGGSLNESRLLTAYSRGIFPWPLDDGWSPMLWFSPDPRFVLFPDELHVSRSLRRTLNQDPFEIRFDTAFEDVLCGCAQTPRRHESGTWITEELVEAYEALHREGHAHSFESYRDGDLVGGVFGVALGRAFFAESMFYRESEASKVALVRMTRCLGERGYRFIDCQQRTDNLTRFGARSISRRRFLDLLSEAVGLQGNLPPTGVLPTVG